MEGLHIFPWKTSRRIEKGAGFNKSVGMIVSFKINKPAGSNKFVQDGKCSQKEGMRLY